MFKLESYITPVLLNYVGKYVKNFRAEQSQVSLWGGDATFQNLDLRLGVLNEQFDLPFTFISGHIHELLIHVPWVKIISEPIVITINTIECILKMKDGSEAEDDVNPQYKTAVDYSQEETPSSYMKSIVTKVVNNITINCNNLILKFVEEDIVLSVNIRFLSMQTVNEDWKPTFTDVNAADMNLRKVMTIEDLTLCLDRMDSSGKIDIYQDPVVYRCSMTIRWIMNYQSNTMKRISITRFDLHCEKMEFSMTEQQIPMLLRLFTLLMESRAQRGAAVDNRKLSTTSDDIENLDEENNSITHLSQSGNNNQAWGSWAWNTLTSFVPVDWNADPIDQSTDSTRQTLNFGIYIDNATLTFKTIDNAKEESFGHKNFKVRYHPFVTLNFSNVISSFIVQGMTFSAIELGFGFISLIPRGNCSCGYPEVKSTIDSKPYISAGELNPTNNYLKNSLFDSDCDENNGRIGDYQQYITDRLSNDNRNSTNSLLEKSTALYIEYVHFIELPEETTEEELYEFGQDCEFSNFKEQDIRRYFIGDLNIRVCSGMLHRISAVMNLIETDFTMCSNKRTEPTVDELPPVTIEEFEALNEYIPITQLKLNIIKISVHIQISDHYRDKRKFRNEELRNFKLNTPNYPILIVGADEINLEVISPLYPFRLAACASKQNDLPRKMLELCYKTMKVNVLGFNTRLNLTDSSHMILILPCTFNLSTTRLLYPQYWNDLHLTRVFHDFKMESLTLTSTKVKLMVVYTILTSNFLSPPNVANRLASSSLYHDACNEKNPVFLELSFESIGYTNTETLKMISKKLSIGSLRLFALNNVSQAFIITAPEHILGNKKLITAQFHYPTDLSDLINNNSSIGIFNIAEMRVLIDPLFLDWLSYTCIDYDVSPAKVSSEYPATEETSSDASTRKKFPSLHENVHSPSDKERKWNALTWMRTPSTPRDTNQNKSIKNFDILKTFVTWRPWWRQLILNGVVETIIIYFPTVTMNGVGLNEIDHAVDLAFAENESLKIISVVTTKSIIQSASWEDQLAIEINKPNFWKSSTSLLNKSKHFPWVINISEFYCYTYEKYKYLEFCRMNSTKATIDVTVKPYMSSKMTSENSLETFGFYTHIDTSPIAISIREEQMELFEKVYRNISRVTDKFMQSSDKDSNVIPDEQEGYIGFQERTPFSPIQILSKDTDTTSTTSTSRHEPDPELDGNSPITSWIQWTIQEIEISLLTPGNPPTNLEYKMDIKFEDIITSIDWQAVYLQMKNKITTATIFHYKRRTHEDAWNLGDCTGLIMSSRDKVEWFETKKITESDFLSVTITCAKSNNVYTKWRGVKLQKIHEEYLFTENNSIAMTNYITEIVIRMKMLDILFPIHIFQQFAAFLNFSQQSECDETTEIIQKKSFPLVYLDFKGLNLIIPTSSRGNQRSECLILETGDINIVPQAKNPICRVILRPDIYELAAQANILNTPGSTVEDRQYQINITNATLYTTTLKNYEISMTKQKSQSLYTMNENPALEWNKLESDGGSNQSSTCIISKFDLSCIIAPPIIFKSNVIICGSAVEVTLMSDIRIILNLEQIKLLSMLSNQLQDLNSNIVTRKRLNSTPKLKDSQPLMTVLKQTNDTCVKSIQESTQDSGVDVDMSSIDVGLRAQPANKISTPSFEYLINGGTVSLLIYESTSAEEYYPLIFMTINQFNTYVSQLNSVKTLRVNCFDFSTAFGDEKRTMSTDLEVENFMKFIIETKNGDPHPNTGIPPSFLEFKCEDDNGKSKIFIEIGRPTKINFALTTINQLNIIRSKILNCLNDNCGISSSNSTSVNDWIIRDKKIDAPEVNLKTKQIVFLFKSECGAELISSLAELNTNLSTRLRKVHGTVEMTSVMLTTSSGVGQSNIKPLLKPFSCHCSIKIIWESWQSIEDTPLIRIQAFSEGLHLEVDPNQIKILQSMQQDFSTLQNKFLTNPNVNSNTKSSTPSTEQYYQDDLKAGAFHFADGTPDQLPLPYQVIFSDFPQMMAWRYPQPRVLTQLSVTEVLFEIFDEDDVDFTKIICTIEYWNDNLMAYQRYIDFNLSELDNFTKLPNKLPTRAVACLWRAVITSLDDERTCPLSARDLAGCIRIDSYFNSSLIPTLEITGNIDVIQLSLYNNITPGNFNLHLPEPLEKFQLNDCLPSSLNFLTLRMKNIVMSYNHWDNENSLIDLTTHLGIQILNHSTMFMQELLQQLETNVQVIIANQITCSIMCKDIWIKFGPEVSHTITVSLDLWRAALRNCENSVMLMTGIIVANDLNIPIRFGQSDSTDGIMLPSRACHFYSWRHERNREMIISYERSGLWSWSKPFTTEDGIYGKPVQFHPDSPDYRDYERIYVTVKSLSSTQKIILITGRIIISNQLDDHFELKLVKPNVITEDVVIVAGHSRPASLYLDEYGNNMAIRLRFANLPNCSWTGDIPLHSNVKCDQPWLVKVPTHEKGQFLSIWVRIIQENPGEHCRTLVVLTPLYIIQSWLPMPVDVQVDTPTLHTSFTTRINGCCQRQQMYCPGTFEHFHQVAFQPQSNIISPISCIPLSYNSIDQRTFFKRPDKEDLEDILKRLDKQNDLPAYPFLNDDLKYWTPVTDTSTNIQIKYRDAGLESSTLLLEIRPWCFIINTSGRKIDLITPEGSLLSTIPHRGIASPPKMEGIFNIEIELNDNTKFRSLPLQLAHSEWNRGFIMPQINGLIPMEGTIKTTIDCGESHSVMFIINSTTHEDMRVLKIMSSHVANNFTSCSLKIVPMIVNLYQSGVDVPLDLLESPECVDLPANQSEKFGIPIIQWYNMNVNHPRNSVSQFICVSDAHHHRWACPVKIDQAISRNCISVWNGMETIPIVVTTQKDHDVTYITILEDNNPQLVIKNSCPFYVVIGQANSSRRNIEPDAPPFVWRLEIGSGQLCHYTVKNFGNKIPDASISNEVPCAIILSSLPNENGGWKKVIELPAEPNIKYDQFVHAENFGDVKIMVESQGHTIHIQLEPKSQMELAVRDIRSRLKLEGAKLPLQNDQKFHTAKHDDVMVRNSEESGDESIDNFNFLIPSAENDNQQCQDRVLTIFFQEINLILTQNINDKKQEVAGFYLTNTIISAVSSPKSLHVRTLIGDMQFDNQMFECGGFDFPVVLISQKPLIDFEKLVKHLTSLESTLAEVKKKCLISLEISWDVLDNKKSCREVHMTIAPMNIYIEDRFVTQLLEYLTAILRPCILISKENIENPTDYEEKSSNKLVNLPVNIVMDARIMSSPLRLQRLVIEPISLLLSVHTSVRLYVALDHSPLHFSIFDRCNLFTTPYRLGNALTMHYLSGAIFGAGWVVGSLEILGSPGSFAQALGVGLKDFIAMPFQGLLQGPWGFIVGITHGSASLMKNITAGTVNSVTKLASSVARNLDRLTLDEEHLQRQEESRRIRPQGMAQGLFQGLTGFGISILAAVGGLAHHPLQHVWSGEATTRGLVTGVGLGLVGVVTKPLSGAAELVALTGQGLLHRTGWNSLPSPRYSRFSRESNDFINTSNRYMWKLMSYLNKKRDCIIHLINAEYSVCDRKIPVTIILTRYNLLIINTEDDKMERVFSLKELKCWEDVNDCKLIYVTTNTEKVQSVNFIEPPEMNQELRTRIEQYVFGSSTTTTAGLTPSISVDNDQPQPSEASTSNPNKKPMVFSINTKDKNNLMAILKIVKRQNQGTDFVVL